MSTGAARTGFPSGGRTRGGRQQGADRVWGLHGVEEGGGDQGPVHPPRFTTRVCVRRDGYVLYSTLECQFRVEGSEITGVSSITTPVRSIWRRFIRNTLKYRELKLFPSILLAWSAIQQNGHDSWCLGFLARRLAAAMWSAAACRTGAATAKRRHAGASTVAPRLSLGCVYMIHIQPTPLHAPVRATQSLPLPAVSGGRLIARPWAGGVAALAWRFRRLSAASRHPPMMRLPAARPPARGG